MDSLQACVVAMTCERSLVRCRLVLSSGVVDVASFLFMFSFVLRLNSSALTAGWVSAQDTGGTEVGARQRARTRPVATRREAPCVMEAARRQRGVAYTRKAPRAEGPRCHPGAAQPAR